MPHTIDHLGVAVRSLQQARTFYEMLGLRVSGEEVVEHEKVKIAMVPLGESRIELLESTAPDSVIATGRAFPGRSRPLCPYSQHAQYNGSGNPEDAANFSCRP